MLKTSALSEKITTNSKVCEEEISKESENFSDWIKKVCILVHIGPIWATRDLIQTCRASLALK